MNWLIVGDMAEERDWCRWLLDRPDHSILAVLPGFEDLPQIPRCADTDALLATLGAEAILVGGNTELRAEALRRAASEGLPALCLHPPGPDADPYYQVALTPQETGAIVVPDLPLRLHPGLAAMRSRVREGTIGALRCVRYEEVRVPGSDLAADAFPRVVDAVRSFIGEIEALTATATPSGERPTEGLTVHMRGPGGVTGEIRLTASPLVGEPTKLVVVGAQGSLTWESETADAERSRIVTRVQGLADSAETVTGWDRRAAMVSTLEAVISRAAARPDLLDGTRSMELAEAVARSLKRGRTIDLHYEEISEVGSFKAVMTSVGCGLILLVLVLFVLSRVGLALDIEAAKYLAWLTIPLMVAFAAVQLLRYAARPAAPSARSRTSEHSDQPPA
jgi:myo-inositol 2-dehydrogenase/D-chiro-inositol 1-dehydrogenase